MKPLSTRAEYTAKIKLEVVRAARVLLGPNGEGWVKGTWFARRTILGNHHPVVKPEEADCFCLAGALDYAAVTLGYKKHHNTSEQVAEIVSVAGVIKEVAGPNVHVPTFNDHADTTWEDIDRVLRKREKQLKKEAGKT